MKKGIVFFLLAVCLSACAGPSGQTAYNCGQGVCTTLEIIEPVRPGEPVSMVITVTADKDIPELGVWLQPDSGGTVEEPPASERAAVTARDQSGMAWGAPAKANQPIRFTRKVRLPPRGGTFMINASATIPGKGPVATDSVRIYLTPGGGTVYRSGTSIPTPATPIRAITLSATPLPRTPTAARTPTWASYP